MRDREVLPTFGAGGGQGMEGGEAVGQDTPPASWRGGVVSGSRALAPTPPHTPWLPSVARLPSPTR